MAAASARGLLLAVRQALTHPAVFAQVTLVRVLSFGDRLSAAGEAPITIGVR